MSWTERLSAYPSARNRGACRLRGTARAVSKRCFDAREVWARDVSGGRICELSGSDVTRAGVEEIMGAGVGGIKNLW